MKISVAILAVLLAACLFRLRQAKALKESDVSYAGAMLDQVLQASRTRISLEYTKDFGSE